jgi:hypothetical protein
MNNRKNCGSKPNRTTYCVPILSLSNSLSFFFCVCKIQSPKSHQLSKLHPKSFPSKNNLKCFHPIQVASHLHDALLNLYHSPNHILPCLISAIHQVVHLFLLPINIHEIIMTFGNMPNRRRLITFLLSLDFLHI